MFDHKIIFLSLSDDEAVVDRFQEDGGELMDEDEHRVPIVHLQTSLEPGFG
jgi:hypothetical protein